MENKKILFKNKRGFTLIEMLIVIVIIGILSAAIIPRLNSARGRANDVARKADLNQVATALITYQLDESHFPTTGTTINNMEKELRAGGLTSIPKDPANPNFFSGVIFEETAEETATAGNYAYTPITKNGIVGGGFVLMAQVESHGQANYVFCDGDTEIGKNTEYGSNVLKLCTSITPSDLCDLTTCKYDEEDPSVLRYIYKY